MLVLVSPVVQINPVKRNSLLANGDLHQVRSDFPVEPVPAHAEIEGGISQAN